MKSVINWLLDYSSPEVKYRTMTELLCMDKKDVDVKKAYDSLLNSDTVNLVMDKFKLDNKWEDVNALHTLTDIGLTREDVLIDCYLERVIKRISQSSMRCAKVLLLRDLVALGYYENPWVKEQISFAFSTIREDGSVRCLDKNKKKNDSGLPDMGCYRQTTTYLLLAAELKKIGVVLPQFKLLTEFFINYKVSFRPEDSEKVIIEEMAKTFYPIDHVHIGLQVILYALSILGVADHPNCEKAWALLNSKKDSEGKYVLDETFYEPYFNIGKAGEPNKWVTLYTLLAQKRKIV